MLEKQKKLLRNYTQNIDTLEQIAGIDNVVECHGKSVSVLFCLFIILWFTFYPRNAFLVVLGLVCRERIIKVTDNKAAEKKFFWNIFLFIRYNIKTPKLIEWKDFF